MTHDHDHSHGHNHGHDHGNDHGHTHSRDDGHGHHHHHTPANFRPPVSLGQTATFNLGARRRAHAQWPDASLGRVARRFPSEFNPSSRPYPGLGRAYFGAGPDERPLR